MNHKKQISASGNAPDTNRRERLRHLRDEIRVHLEGGLIPFWLACAEDKEYGGFLTNFDAQGRHTGTPEKYLNTQCRLIWIFAHLQRSDPREEFAHLARQGVDFLLAHFWDPEHGGFFWKCRRDGIPLDDGNIGNPWKVSYHTGRAMIDCIGRLGRLRETPVGAQPLPEVPGMDGRNASAARSQCRCPTA